MMNYFKKIDHYLLLNHPILWRTKVHYFMLFSLILGNMLAFGLGYFPVKYFGAIDLDIVSVIIGGLIIFTVLAWFITQARNKIRYYNFWDEVLTFAIYVIFTASLFGNLILFERTITYTTARLVSVEQIDIDTDVVSDNDEPKDSGFLNLYPSASPPYHVVAELADRYQLNTSFKEDEIDDKVSEISRRINRIYWTQMNLSMRKSGLVCGMQWGGIERYHLHIILTLCISILLFCISHVHLRTVLSVVLIYCILAVPVFMIISVSEISGLALYGVLCALAVHGKDKIHRFSVLLIIPYTLMFCFGIMMILRDEYDIFNHINTNLFMLVGLLLASILTIFTSAFFIKRYFEPTT